MPEGAREDGDSERVARSGARRNRAARAAPTIPGYRIEGILARGSSATVYRARQLAVDREVALKVLHPELAGRKRVVMRLQREARTAARLAHPHIVSAIDMGEVDGLWWFAMELVQGPSLALRLRQHGPLDERAALRLFIPLCEALVHLYENGVVHRDIKPANVLIDDSGGARLADLGLAFSDGDPVLTAQGGTLGTPHYISPEQARDPSAVDGRADLWSFGATLYHALCGEPPFQGDSLAEVLSGVLHARIPDPREIVPDLSKGIVLVVRKCLSRDLSLRYESPRQLLLDLERVRERRAPHIDPRALEPVERRGTSVVAWYVAALAAVLVAVLAWAVAGEGQEANPVSSSPTPVAKVPDRITRLADRAHADSSRLAAALSEVSAYAETAPEDLLRQLRALESELSIELREELRVLRGEQEQTLADLVAKGDLIAARAALETGFEEELRARTGYASATLPDGLARNRAAWRADRDRELARATEVAVGVLISAAEGHYERVVLPEVERDIRRRAWRTARRQLTRSPVELAEAAGASTDGIPRALLEESFAGLRSRLRVREDLLVDEWTRIEAGLHRWIDRRASELESDLRSRRRRAGTADELRADFDRRLEQEGLLRSEFLEPEGAAVTRELERRCAELSELEQSLLSQETVERFDLLQDVFAPKWPAREYSALVEIWTRYREEISELPETPGSDWRERHLAEVDVVLREAELLDDLLERAARGLVRRSGSELELRLGNIPVRGRLSLSGDPRTRSFSLITPQGERVFELRELDARDLLELAEPGPGEDGLEDADRRLRAALLSFRDGDPKQALSLSSAGALPEEGLDARLARELRDRSLELLQEAERSDRDRNREAEELFAQVDVARPGSGQLAAVRNLLESYGDTPIVRERGRELRDLRDRLLEPPPRPDEDAYEAAFDPLAIEFGRDRVRLIFEFGPKASRAWERGDWEVDWDAWVAPPAPTLSDLAEVEGPRLSLAPPGAVLDPSGELELRLDVELSEDQHVLVSAAGFHVSLCGPRCSVPGARGWLVTSGTLEQHVEALRHGKGNLDPFLHAGEIERVDLVLRPRSGRVALVRNGKELDSATVRAPKDAARRSLVEVRAGGGARLRRVEVEGRRP